MQGSAMLLLAALVAQTDAPEPRVVAQSRATVRIERPVAVGAAQWETIAEGQRREILTHDESGRPLLLRLVENP